MGIAYEPIGGDHGRILEKYFTSTFRKGWVNVKGTTMPLRYVDLAQSIFNWKVTDSDYWICSFPKTGTTWTQEMVWLIANNLDFEGAKENLGSRFPFLEVSALFDYRDLMVNNPDFQPPPFLQDSLKFVEERPHPRFLKSHLPWDLLPNDIRDGNTKPKIIYIARNPKDTCVSYYNHSRLLEGYTGNFDDFCELFLAGKLSFAPYWNHVLPFWKKRDEPNTLFLKYEELIKDLPSIIQKVAVFLGKELKDDDVKILNKHLSFEEMKKNQAVNYDMVVSLNRRFKLIEESGCFMRSGTVGNYKANMTPEMIKRFDDWTKKNTEGTDLCW